MSLSKYDHDMIHHAADRGPVVVVVDGRPIEATLIAWRPRRKPRGDGSRRERRNYARVQYISGGTASVKCGDVHLLIPVGER